MENRIDAIYARQSVDRKDSISIESQIEFCKYELRGGNFKDYKDKGFSGKNTDRPRFQELMADIKRGLIRRVVVYKLDRISRSILDFATMMELFQQYNVEFVSSTEKFDTSTPMGRAMLNICIVFAISWCRKSPGRWPGVCSREAEKSTGQPSKYRSWRSRAGKSSCLRAAG